MRRPLIALAAGALLTFAAAPAAAAHHPGTEGSPARACGKMQVRGATVAIGATRVQCRVARKAARRVLLGGRRLRRWPCRGVPSGAGFGHCHGTGPRRRAIVHWGIRHSS